MMRALALRLWDAMRVSRATRGVKGLATYVVSSSLCDGKKEAEKPTHGPSRRVESLRAPPGSKGKVLVTN